MTNWFGIVKYSSRRLMHMTEHWAETCIVHWNQFVHALSFSGSGFFLIFDVLTGVYRKSYQCQICILILVWGYELCELNTSAPTLFFLSFTSLPCLWFFCLIFNALSYNAKVARCINAILGRSKTWCLFSYITHFGIFVLIIVGLISIADYLCILESWRWWWIAFFSIIQVF